MCFQRVTNPLLETGLSRIENWWLQGNPPTFCQPFANPVSLSNPSPTFCQPFLPTFSAKANPLSLGPGASLEMRVSGVLVGVSGWQTVVLLETASSPLVGFQQIEDHPHPQSKRFIWHKRGGRGSYAIVLGPYAIFSKSLDLMGLLCHMDPRCTAYFRGTFFCLQIWGWGGQNCFQDSPLVGRGPLLGD